MYVEIFILFSYSMVFGLLYDLCHTLYNPFGPRCLDVPHKVVGGGIRRMAIEFSKGHTPPTMETGSIQGRIIAVDMTGDVEVKPLCPSKRISVLGDDMSENVEVDPLYPSKRFSIFGVQRRQSEVVPYSTKSSRISFLSAESKNGDNKEDDSLF